MRRRPWATGEEPPGIKQKRPRSRRAGNAVCAGVHAAFLFVLCVCLGLSTACPAYPNTLQRPDGSIEPAISPVYLAPFPAEAGVSHGELLRRRELSKGKKQHHLRAVHLLPQAGSHLEQSDADATSVDADEDDGDKDVHPPRLAAKSDPSKRLKDVQLNLQVRSHQERQPSNHGGSHYGSGKSSGKPKDASLNQAHAQSQPSRGKPLSDNKDDHGRRPSFQHAGREKHTGNTHKDSQYHSQLRKKPSESKDGHGHESHQSHRKPHHSSPKENPQKSPAHGNLDDKKHQPEQHRVQSHSQSQRHGQQPHHKPAHRLPPHYVKHPEHHKSSHKMYHNPHHRPPHHHMPPHHVKSTHHHEPNHRHIPSHHPKPTHHKAYPSPTSHRVDSPVFTVATKTRGGQMTKAVGGQASSYKTWAFTSVSFPAQASTTPLRLAKPSSGMSNSGNGQSDKMSSLAGGMSTLLSDLNSASGMQGATSIGGAADGPGKAQETGKGQSGSTANEEASRVGPQYGSNADSGQPAPDGTKNAQAAEPRISLSIAKAKPSSETPTATSSSLPVSSSHSGLIGTDTQSPGNSAGDAGTGSKGGSDVRGSGGSPHGSELDGQAGDGKAVSPAQGPVSAKSPSKSDPANSTNVLQSPGDKANGVSGSESSTSEGTGSKTNSISTPGDNTSNPTSGKGNIKGDSSEGANRGGATDNGSGPVSGGKQGDGRPLVSSSLVGSPGPSGSVNINPQGPGHAGSGGSGFAGSSGELGIGKSSSGSSLTGQAGDGKVISSGNEPAGTQSQGGSRPGKGLNQSQLGDGQSSLGKGAYNGTSGSSSSGNSVSATGDKISSLNDLKDVSSKGTGQQGPDPGGTANNGSKKSDEAAGTSARIDTSTGGDQSGLQEVDLIPLPSKAGSASGSDNATSFDDADANEDEAAETHDTLANASVPDTDEDNDDNDASDSDTAESDDTLANAGPETQQDAEEGAAPGTPSEDPSKVPSVEIDLQPVDQEKVETIDPDDAASPEPPLDPAEMDLEEAGEVVGEEPFPGTIPDDDAVELQDTSEVDLLPDAEAAANDADAMDSAPTEPEDPNVDESGAPVPGDETAIDSDEADGSLDEDTPPSPPLDEDEPAEDSPPEDKPTRALSPIPPSFVFLTGEFTHDTALSICLLAAITTENEAAAFAMTGGAGAWIASWNGDDYSGSCIALESLGGIGIPAGGCDEPLGVICQTAAPTAPIQVPLAVPMDDVDPPEEVEATADDPPEADDVPAEDGAEEEAESEPEEEPEEPGDPPPNEELAADEEAAAQGSEDEADDGEPEEDEEAEGDE